MTNFSGNETMGQLAERYYPRVRKMARHLARRLPSSIDAEDLVQAAMTALLTAARAFDPARGQSLDAYLVCRVRGAMLDELRALDPLSRDERKDVRAIDAASRELASELGRAPTQVEVAAKAGLATERVYTLEERREAVQVASFDEGLERYGQVADPTELLSQKRAAERVQGAVSSLSPRHQQILSMRYREELSLKEIGHALAVTESRVCQLHSEAVSRLRSVVLGEVTTQTEVARRRVA